MPINAVDPSMRSLLSTVLKSDSKLLGYFVRVTSIKDIIPKLERNESNNEIEIGCTLRVRHSPSNLNDFISGETLFRQA